MHPLQSEKKQQAHAQPVFVQTEHAQAERRAEAAPVQAPQQVHQEARQEHTLPGEAMARAMARQLAADQGGAQPPLAPPAPMQAEEAAPKTKKERAIQKRRQEEAERRHAEELQRQQEEEERRRAEERRRQEEEEDRAEEAKRQQRRTMLFQDDAVRALLEAYIKTPSLKTAADFLYAAGRFLLDHDQELADFNEGSVDFATQAVPPFQLLIATQIEDGETADALMDKLQEHRAQFQALDAERPLMSFITRGLLVILQEECLLSKDLERVADAIATAYQERSELQRQAWDSFEAVVARNVHVHPKKGANSVNVFASGSPFRYLTKRETIEEFRQQTEALMQQDKTLTREAAEKQVMARHRASLAEQAQARTLESSVVPGVSAQDWAAHGGASYHYTLPAAKAYQAVDRSNGFLYAKPAGNGLCELRPTLPETVEIRGNTIPLRRSYTLMIKAILHLLLDEQGNLREHAEDLAYRISELRDPSVSEALLNTELRPHLITILGGDESHADETIGHLTTLMQASSNESFPPREIMYGLAGDMQRMNIPALMESKVRRMQEIDQKMQAEGHSTEEIQRALDAFSASFRSLFADLDQAHRELMTIRNMDPNSLEVPLPNACSAHANFINGIREGCMGAEAAQAHTLSFETASHIMAHPLVHIDHCLAHLDSIAWPIVHSTREETVPRLQALRAEIQAAQQQGQPYQLSDADRNLLCILVIKASKVPAKYEYHMAANLGKTDDGLQITSEGFAAETKQYMVSPFSLHHAVGLYRGNEEKHAITGAYSNTGMVTYYCRDNPLPSDADAALLAAKLSLRGEDGGVNA